MRLCDTLAHNHHTLKVLPIVATLAMVGNYDIDATVEMAKWDADEADPTEQHIATLEELYFEPATGDLVLTFEARETDEFFDVSVAVKAVGEWNEFVDGLPRVD